MTFGPSIPGCLAISPTFLGVSREVERLLEIVLDSKEDWTPVAQACEDALVAYVYRTEVKPLYAGRTWPDKPVIVWLRSGARYRLYEDGRTEPWKG